VRPAGPEQREQLGREVEVTARKSRVKGVA
jgi:hypothetical protein